MTKFEKQIRAIRKILVLNYSKNPAHCKACIEEIDVKLAELDESEYETLDFSDDPDLQNIA